MMLNEEKYMDRTEQCEDSKDSSKHVSANISSRSKYGDVKTVWEILVEGCRISDDGDCLGIRNAITGYSWISYNTFIQRAEHFGSGMICRGMISGQVTKIGIYAQNSIEWIVAQFGCFSQSMIVVPLYDTLGSNASSYIIRQAEIQMVVCDTKSKARNLLNKIEETPCLSNIIMVDEITKELDKLAKEKGIQLDSFRNIENTGKTTPTEPLLPRSSDVSHICYSSGTTGDPKGVVLTHNNIVSATIGSVECLNFTKNDTMISYLPLAHIFEQIAETVLFLSGGKIGFFSGDVSLLVEDMRVLKPTFFPAVPRILNRFYDKAQDLFKSKGIINNCQPPGISQPSIIQKREKTPVEIALYKAFLEGLGGEIRTVLSGGAPISGNVLEFYRTGLGCKVLEVYGQTECAGPCCINIVSDETLGCVGSPITDSFVKLVDVPDMGYFSASKQGEVCIKGPHVFKGYLKNPKLTLETLDRDGWLHTGDIGVLTTDGRLKIVDRKKHIFKLSQGEYIAPEKIENIYMFSRFISQIFVEGHSSKNYLVAVIIPNKEAVLPWCKDKICCDSWTAVCENPDVKRLILEDMNQLGKTSSLCGFEQVKDIFLHPKDLTFEDGFLTPTLKVKREVLRKYFSKEIDAMYKSNE